MLRRLRCRRRAAARALLAAGALALAAAASADPPTELPAVQVIGNAPLPGSGIDADKVPSNVQTLTAKDLGRDGSNKLLPAGAAARMPSVNLNDQQGNPYQTDFGYRGFEASPISGVAQGLAVYQNGVRINESFGDGVNWDLLPQVAVNRLTVQGNNTVFGLNALGGAVSLEMKNGFNYGGAEAQLAGGSYGYVGGYGQYGRRFGPYGVYAAVSGTEDDGFRYRSRTTLRQLYTDIGRETGRASIHLSVSAAQNDIGALGPTPVQMLAQDPRAIFTYPQSMHNEMLMTQLSGSYEFSDSLQLQANAYYRHFLQHLTDGNTTDVQACDNNPGFFCLEGANQYPGDALHNSAGQQVPTSVLPAGATPGEVDYTDTYTSTAGAALQLTFTRPLLGLSNHLVAGASFDHGYTRYDAYGILGSLSDTLGVQGVGVVIDQSGSSTAQPPLEEPVGVRATNQYYGLYLTDTLDLTQHLSWTLSGRYNKAGIGLQDQFGGSLNAAHNYARFNPGTGFAYKLGDGLTAYLGYAESNRAPTAGELSCADPQRPCLLDTFLVADPELKQVTARTYELGLRGRFAAAALPGRFRWNLGVFRTDNHNDIILLSTAVNGFGYYANAGTTRRQGIESSLAWRWSRWDLSLGYSLLDATYRSAQTLSSSSPAADADGNIFVHRGDRLPLSPMHRATFNAEYSATKRWTVGTDLRFVDSQFLAGDSSNQEPRLPPYLVLNLHSAYQLWSWLQVFGEIDNLADRTYYTYGAFSDYAGLPPRFAYLSNPRTYSPSPGRTVYAGLRAGF